ncbi:MAG: hypothetical protein KA515_02925 [Candidatus Pacebacteria bacterium]|nr:hypothetical protein [Candidatus Paceibacterota bacterium]
MEHKPENKICQNCKQDFTIEPEDFNFYEKMNVPPPTFCPDCRLVRRLIIRNNRVFYKQECGLCKIHLLSIHDKDQPHTVFCRDCWLSDKWNPLDYGQDYDFSKPFFEQFNELQINVPRFNLYRDNFIQSDYCNYGSDFKECYLLYGGKNNERVYFGNQILESRDSMDVAFSEKLEFCYENFECIRNNKLFFSHHSSDCVDSSYLIDCRNCTNCFGCVNLVNKQYNIFNVQYSKDEYHKFIKENEGSFKKHLENLEKLHRLELSLPHRYARVYKSVNSDGDDLSEARNTSYAFSSRLVEDSKFLFFCRTNSKDCYDNCFQGFNSEKCYETAHTFGGNNCMVGSRNFNSQDTNYSEDCHDCKSVFGCEGLRKKSYCILNKQYSKKEYEELLSKIIEHMKKTREYGEFFPSAISPFAYNESIAQEYFPLTKIEAINQGFRWKDEEERNYKIEIENKDIPDHINDVDEDIVNKVIACEHLGHCTDQCTEAFKIVPEEFKFYKRMNLPLPRLCPNCRHYQRINKRNPLRLWHRKCMKQGCGNEFKTTYAPDRPEIVYCEKCYQQEVY